jgi:hypothetical protein
MARLPRLSSSLLPLSAALLVGAVVLGQPQPTAPPAAVVLGQPQPTAPAAPQEKGTMLLTVFLKHDQSKTLTEIKAHLEAKGFWQKFPPPGVEVVSWYVMMGIGQVVTLRFPAEKLRDVNLAIEQSAWGAYRTEFDPTYDSRAAAESQRSQTRK